MAWGHKVSGLRYLAACPSCSLVGCYTVDYAEASQRTLFLNPNCWHEVENACDMSGPL